MLALDTDHLAEIERNSPAGTALSRKLAASSQDAVTTIISAEEQLRGWLAFINRTRAPERQIVAYERLQERLAFFANWELLALDASAAEHFKLLRNRGVRIGSMDLKIACIVITNDATLLSRNLADFGQVPGLHVEDWL
jgi:tRNA(fMet)-specific endonuclease VapC